MIIIKALSGWFDHIFNPIFIICINELDLGSLWLFFAATRSYLAHMAFNLIANSGSSRKFLAKSRKRLAMDYAVHIYFRINALCNHTRASTHKSLGSFKSQRADREIKKLEGTEW